MHGCATATCGPRTRTTASVLRLLQWHCPPRLWHLKTPVHMFALDDLLASYPNARFLWSHRDPAAVLASVCRPDRTTPARWVSDRDDADELGAGELELWAEAVRRAMDFRARVGAESGSRFADVAHADLQTDPVGAVAGAYETIGIDFPAASQRALNTWARQHPPRSGRVDYDLERYGLTATEVRSAFAEYLESFNVS